MVIALVAMIVSLYVPHHHHEEAVCIGNYDCKKKKYSVFVRSWVFSFGMKNFTQTRTYEYY